jgi:transcriptional regulator with XRE-family HTH domain
MCYNVYTGTNTKCVTQIQEVIKMDTVFDNIRAECARRHITIDELADKLGIERKTFYNWENRKDFPVSMLKKMASLFGITTDELLGLK